MKARVYVGLEAAALVYVVTVPIVDELFDSEGSNTCGWATKMPWEQTRSRASLGRNGRQ